jgi:hypothetical protein
LPIGGRRGNQTSAIDIKANESRHVSSGSGGSRKKLRNFFGWSRAAE